MAAVIAVAVPRSDAVTYMPEPDPVYEALSLTIYCMNHFRNRTTGYLGVKSAIAAQADLETKLKSLNDAAKTADAMGMALMAIGLPRKDDGVPVICWRFVPNDHDLNPEQLKYFLSHSAL